MSMDSVVPFSVDELERLRSDTPAWGSYVHFAHGSVSLPPRPVFTALESWLQLEQRQGTHRALSSFRDDLEQTRAGVARLIGAQAHQIAFVDSASRGWALALAAACDNADRVDVVTSEHEWGGSAINLLHARTQGRIGALHVLSETGGDGLQQALEKMAPATRAVVSLPAVVMVDGRLADLSGAADLVRKHEGLLFVDASHAVGQRPVDVTQIGVDVLVFPARKWLRGPKGISVLYVSDRALGMLGAPPTLDIASAVWDSDTSCRPRDDARRFEVYEFHPGLRLALRAAVDYALQTGVDRIAARNREVLHSLRARLGDELDIQTVAGKDATAFLTCRIDAGKADALMKVLEENGVNASLVGKQYARWAMTARGMEKLLRLTPHYITAESEIESLVTVLKAHRSLLD